MKSKSKTVKTEQLLEKRKPHSVQLASAAQMTGRLGKHHQRDAGWLRGASQWPSQPAQSAPQASFTAPG